MKDQREHQWFPASDHRHKPVSSCWVSCSLQVRGRVHIRSVLFVQAAQWSLVSHWLYWFPLVSVQTVLDYFQVAVHHMAKSMFHIPSICDRWVDYFVRTWVSSSFWPISAELHVECWVRDVLKFEPWTMLWFVFFWKFLLCVCVCQGGGGPGLQGAGQGEGRPGSGWSEEPAAGQRGGRPPRQHGEPEPEQDQVRPTGLYWSLRPCCCPPSYTWIIQGEYLVYMSSSYEWVCPKHDQTFFYIKGKIKEKVKSIFAPVEKLLFTLRFFMLHQCPHLILLLNIF